MFSLPYLCICVYCMLQLSFLFVMDNKRRYVRTVQERYFSILIVISLISFMAEIISSLYIGPAWIFPYAVAGTFGEIILNTITLPIFFLYVCKQIYNIDLALKQRVNIILCILGVICISIVISTAFTGQVFYFDKARMYHRGPMFWLPMSILLLMMAIIEGFIINQKSKIGASYYGSLIFFLIFPIIGWVFQMSIYGLPFSLIGATLAAQIVFTNIQNRSMDTDYLTGVFNRQALDNHMQNKINSAVNGHAFSAMLLDIDYFKSINDRFGHYEGDIALVSTANILRGSAGPEDFIARYGGDEFCIIFENGNEEALKAAINNIESNLAEYNKSSKKQYDLSFSIGYDVYNPMFGNRAEMFFKVIDKKMYDIKKARKAVNETA